MLKKYFYLSLFSLLFVGNVTNILASTKLYHGIGQSSNLRVGPGKDAKMVNVYSLNYVMASTIFDGNGRIINVIIDILELSTPNYDGASMPHFSGWPETTGYNITDHQTKEVTGISENTIENIMNEVAQWRTKRDRGIEYAMNPKNEWDKQMNFYQSFFRGKTIAEIEEWFKKSTSDKNGRPLQEKSITETDKEKYNNLTDEDKKILIDVVAGASMSLKDGHGDILGAIKKSYENRVEFFLTD